jgi:metal-responsive CopG/Arc/MetJ family transcriptional regulator
MNRIVIELPDEDLRLLDAIKETQNMPRSEIIRLAINDYLAVNRMDEPDTAFGVWQEKNGDGLGFQTALRDEW